MGDDQVSVNPREIVLSNYPFFLIFFILISTLICLPTNYLGFCLIIIGLVVDACGASLAVSVDTRLEKYLKKDEIQEKADDLRTFRSRLISGESQGKKNRGFEEAISAIRRHRSFSSEPDKLWVIPNNGTKEVRAEGDHTPVTVSGDYDGTDKSSIAPIHVVDSWFLSEIQDIERSNKQPLRKRGLVFILAGFLIQIFGYLTMRVEIFQNILKIVTICEFLQ